MNIAILIILFVMMQLWRWQHSGRVCSGDYLEEVTEDDREIYLITEGKFIKVILYIVYVLLGLAGLAFCIIAGCSMTSSDDGKLEKK